MVSHLHSNQQHLTAQTECETEPLDPHSRMGSASPGSPGLAVEAAGGMPWPGLGHRVAVGVVDHQTPRPGQGERDQTSDQPREELAGCFLQDGGSLDHLIESYLFITC